MALYESKYSDLQVLIRSESIQYHQATGVEIGRVKPLVANFGFHGPEIPVLNPLTGQTETHGQIHGHFYDTEEAKERLGWTDDEHESVIYALNKLCREQPFLIAPVEMTIPELSKPWPTYDETHWKTIPVLAAQLGLREAALSYERENKNREAVIAALELEARPLPVEETKTEEGLITLA